jgi:membrane protease YdiL (CAAX protease family)
MENFSPAFLRVLPFGLVAIVAFFVIGYLLGTINLTWHIIPILLLYPIWGTIQQFLLISLVAGNIRDMKSWNPTDVAIILISATLFGVVHYPVLWLVGGTFLLALFYGYMFLKSRNLYALGLFHGWLGGIFYYTVLNTDPFMETIGKLIN